MIDVCIIRALTVTGQHGPNDDRAPSHLSAASGLVRIGQRLYVVADDEHWLGVFDLSDDGPGSLLALLNGELPSRHRARKLAKPDLESLTVLPALSGHPCGALLAVGSGSRPNRQRALCIGLDAHGGLAGTSQQLDFTGLFDALREHIPDVNIEGAFIDSADLCLLQRGNAGSPLNACIRWPWQEVEAWLRAAGPVPSIASISRFDLGHLGGVPLGFTDAAALPGGGWVFCAAAEDTDDSVADGHCQGSALGWVSAAGELRLLQPMSLSCKAEGIAVVVDGAAAKLLLVTDADDRDTPSLLLATTLSLT